MYNIFKQTINTFLTEDQIPLFIESLDLPITRSVRYNPFKQAPKDIDGEKVAWCKEGIKLNEKKVFTTDPLFHSGGYYVQEASSMYIEEIFEKIVFPNTGKEITVLDLCAAPGGKSTHISALLGKNGVVVANETIRSRASVLRENALKWGAGNIIVTNSDPDKFERMRGYFDVILVDAPCSGEGMFRKNEKARQQWSPSNIELCVQRQRRIISNIWGALKEGGFLLYSTCTFNTKENEENISWILENFDATPITEELDLYGKVVATSQSSKGYRFFPHKVNSEGFFISVIQKNGIASQGKARQKTNKKFSQARKDSAKIVSPLFKEDSGNLIEYNNTIYHCNDLANTVLCDIYSDLEIVYFGTEVGEILNKQLKPAHALALSIDIDDEAFNKVDVDLETALEFLRKNSIDATPFQEGYNIITYKEIPMGFVKKVANRVNNLYPKEFRILNL